MEKNTTLIPEIESHPWEPFIPDGAKILIMGTFPPGEHRWCMDFYYPNPTNDFWRIMGLIFLGSPEALYMPGTCRFDEMAVRRLMSEKCIALNDTARRIRRLQGNASDKFLEILEPVSLYDLMKRMPCCHTVATTGQKAAEVVAGITGTEVPDMGAMVECKDGFEIWRMPSSSRAYPMRLEKKAEYYRTMLSHAGII